MHVQQLREGEGEQTFIKSRKTFSFPENLPVTPAPTPTQEARTRIVLEFMETVLCFFVLFSNFRLYIITFSVFFFSCLFSSQELFVETIAKDAYCCAQQGKRKTLQRRDLGRVSLWYLGSGGRQGRPGLGPSRLSLMPVEMASLQDERCPRSHPVMFSGGLPQCQKCISNRYALGGQRSAGQRTKGVQALPKLTRSLYTFSHVVLGMTFFSLRCSIFCSTLQPVTLEHV